MKHNYFRNLFTALLLLCSTVAFAHDFVVDGIYYNFTGDVNKTVEVTYKGSYGSEYSNEYSGAVNIPASVTYNGTTYSVTSIGESAFYDCTALTSVTILNSVLSIGDMTFSGCSGLTSIEIPNSVTSIGERAFYYCSGLTSITIPNSVTSIGWSAFEGCSSLKTVINLSNMTFSKGSYDYGFVAYYAERVINANGYKQIGDYLFNGNTLVCYIGSATELTLPADCNGENYVIGTDAFKGNTTITSIEIPNSVISIGESAFEGCTNIENLYISNSLESIGAGLEPTTSGL